MIDFVHLNWISYKKEQPPVKDDYYLFLVKNKNTGQMFIQEIVYYDFEEGSMLNSIFNGNDSRFEIIAWTNPTNIAFDCDPEHYHECGKKDCNISNDCSTCHKTVKFEHAKWADWFR